MVALTYAASAIATGILLVVVALGLTNWADWRRGPPDGDGRDGDGEGDSGRLLAIVAVGAVLLFVVAVAILATGGGAGAGAGAGDAGGAADGAGSEDGGLGMQGLALAAFGALFGTLLVGFLVWGVYSSARYRGLASAQAAGAGAWVLGMVLVAGITVALLFA
jgi:hypothetical protein